MSAPEKQDRGLLQVDVDECKGCGLCIEACPTKVIRLSEHLNRFGYQTAAYAGARCTACGICFLVCPEPGAIRILRVLHQAVPAGPEITLTVKGEPRCASN